VPDIVLPRHRVAIFVHGCFWHRHAACKLSKLPATRTEFWRAKLQKNVERDRTAQASLLREGWRVMTVWECATRDRDAAKRLGSTIRNWIASGEAVGSISSGGE
jgi:DNA mismatch endonuclease (patch repair protein)